MQWRAEAGALILLSVALCGSAGRPSRTIVVKPGGSIAAAVATARPGDHVRLSRGTYQEPTIVILQKT